jgi:hypothetical protein
LITVYFDADEETERYFTEGQCMALAYELHQLTGWTLALISDQPVGSEDYMGHVFVIDSDGNAIDIKGKREISDIQDDWYFCGHLHRFFSLKEFEYEMLDWDMLVRFDKDKNAKMWAKYIVDMLKMYA